MISGTTIAWWMGLCMWPFLIFSYGSFLLGAHPFPLLVGGIAVLVTWFAKCALVPLETNRPPLGAALYMIGVAELPHPFEDVHGLSQYESDVWRSESFLRDFLPWTQEAAKRVYGNKTSANLLHGMLYFEQGDVRQDLLVIGSVLMKSGVLVGAESESAAAELAEDLTERFQHPELDVEFTAKSLPTNLPIHLEHYAFSESGLRQASVDVNADPWRQYLRDMSRRLVGGTEPAKSRSLSLILFAKHADVQKGLDGDVQGISIDRIFFGNR